MQKMPPAIFTGTVFGLLQSFGLAWTWLCWALYESRLVFTNAALEKSTIVKIAHGRRLWNI